VEEQLPKKFGKYTLLRRLAVGGMAEIFLALHRSISGFEKLLVIKRILPNLTQDQEFLRMFLDEARIAATLNHPNIAQIYDVGSIGDSYFIAMEYVHGEDLRSIVRGMKKRAVASFPLEHTLQIIVGICAGLEYAHTRTDLQGSPLEIVHRDISPQNVLVTFTGDIKVVDFGIARAKMVGFEEKTDRGQLKGKVPYMSPEQCRGLELDRRSDIFSTGILLFELTTGRRLFRGETEFNTLRMIVEEDYPRPSQFLSGYPPDLEAIVLRALARDREQRYQSARELQVDLEEFIRQHRLHASTLNLAKFLEGIFEEKLAAQREALAEGKRLADIIAAEEQHAPELPSGELVELDAQGRPSVTAVPVQPGPSTAAWVERKSSSRTRRLVLAAIALVLVLGSGGAVVFFTRSGGTTTEEPETLGQVEVATVPEGAAISVDGRSTGAKTPFVLTGLRTGKTYQLKLVLEGYSQELREVRLTPARPTESVSLELRPAGRAIFVIKTRPAGATVYVDGRAHDGVTPATIAELAPNEPHAVLVKLPGYRDASDTATAAPGQVREISFELEEAPLGDDECYLAVASVPEGAQVSLDGAELPERTPFRKRVAAGRTVELVLSAPGFDSFRKSVRLRGGEMVEVEAELKRSRRAPPGPVAPRGTGRLYFDAVPFCNVTIDGRSFGPTPLVGVELPAGRRRVTCTSPPIGVTKTVTVEVPTDGTVRHRIKLAP
jgi:serine/threonine-protein kinase